MEDQPRSLSPLTADDPSRNGKSTYVAASQINSGSCPGGGRCNGTGGADGCNGCPAFNNRVAKVAQMVITQPPAVATPVDEAVNGERSTGDTFQEVAMPQLPVQEMPQNMVLSCQNCGTTITPLWRRDEGGRTICNACGRFRTSIPYFGCTHTKQGYITSSTASIVPLQ